jgi:lipopolysaccharide export system protein LptA
VWTPKRIVMLVAGFVLFFVAYAAYSATYFGAIDSLPPLPEAYKRKDGGTEYLPPPPPPTNKIDLKLQQAFGIGCPEIKWHIKLDLNAKNMVISSEASDFEGGRLKLVPISIALFGKDKGDGKGIEINTVRAKTAYLTFDRPVNSPNEANGRKIVEMELIENIEIVNNRRTPGRDDDLTLNIQTGPLYYNEPKHLIWTKDNIHLVDRQSKPDPIDVRGKGMDMELLTQALPPANPGAPPAAKNKNETITGVKRIVLNADVVMHLYTVPGSGMMGAPKKSEPARPARNATAAAEAGTKKEHIEIRTQGRFQYDFLKEHDLATFDVPAGDMGLHLPQDVTVTRYHVDQGGTDELVCQHLELRLKHRDSTAQPGKPQQGTEGEQSLEVETVHATAGAREVLLKSDPEKLDAHGNDFFYDALKKQSILKGEPEMWADRDGSIVHAREMRTQEMKPPPGSPPGAEGYQQVIALGPGSIHMGAKGSDKKTTHAYWADCLTSTRDGGNDLLVLTGSARFVDDEKDQSLQAETIKLWLLGEDKNEKAGPRQQAAAAAPAPGAGPALGGEQGRKPHHLEATGNGNVVLHSRDLNIHNTSRLVTWWKDVDQLPGTPKQDPHTPAAAAPRKDLQPAPPATVPPPGPPGNPAALSPASPAPSLVPGGSPARANPAPPASPLSSASLLGAPVPQTAPAAPNQPPPRPIDLSANTVEAWVLRCGDKNQLDKMWTEGNVHVRQEPARPDEKALDIQGETMQMTAHPEGNELVVNGDLAQLQMDKIYIIGPEVNIDQATNRAWVHGVGAMQMESATNFQGAKLEKTVPLEVHWNSDMLFNGEYAEFLGGIQATQEHARLACERLQVFFDKPISLKEGNRGDQPAKVRNLLADKSVRVEDSSYENGRLAKYQLIIGTLLQEFTLSPDETSPRGSDGKAKECNQVTVSGPGSVRLLQRGAADPAAPPGRTATAKPGGPVVGTPVSVARGAGPDRRPGRENKPEDTQMKMTFVSFLHRMDANSKTNTAKFWGSVRVLNFPCDNPHQEIDIDAIIGRELPPGVLFLRADFLEVLDQPDNGKPNQQMKARGRVRVQAREFWGESDEMSYEEQKDLVIFTGTKDNFATLTKQEVIGGQWQTIRGRKIHYKRSTGEAWGETVDSINGFDQPVSPRPAETPGR